MGNKGWPPGDPCRRGPGTMGHQPSTFLCLRAKGGPQAAPRLRSSPPEVCSAHPCAVELGALPACSACPGPHPSGWAGPQWWSLRVGPWGAGGLGYARTARSAQMGNLKPKGCAASSRVTVGVAREAPFSGPARAQAACLAPLLRSWLGRGRAGPRTPHLGVIDASQLQQARRERQTGAGPRGDI